MNLSDIHNLGAQELDVIAYTELAWGDTIGIYLRYRTVFNNKVFIPKPLEFEESDILSGERTFPLFRLRRYPKEDEAQKLMDSLWDCGLRPSQGKGSAGAMDATQKHLEDMRKIVASKLTVEL